LVKGISRRVIVVKSPDPRMFEEAIFIVREEAQRGISQEELVREAREVARNYVQTNLKKRPAIKIPAPMFAVLGAVGTVVIWLVLQCI